MNKGTHEIELIDDENDIYQCKKCGKTGTFNDFIGFCKIPNSDDIDERTPFDFLFKDHNSFLGRMDSDPIDTP